MANEIVRNNKMALAQKYRSQGVSPTGAQSLKDHVNKLPAAMRPGNVGAINRVFWPFWFTTPITEIVPNSAIQTLTTITQEAAFIWMSYSKTVYKRSGIEGAYSYTLIDSLNEEAIGQADGLSFTIRDSSSSRTFHNKPLEIDQVGSGEFPSVLPTPMMLLPNSQVEVTWQNNNGVGLFSPPATVIPIGTPAFGTARSYGILGASTVTNAAYASVVNGNLGVSPGSAITGFPPGTYTGTEDMANAASALAQADALATYTDLTTRVSTPLPGGDILDGQFLTPGVWDGGALTLDGGGALTLTGTATDIFVIKSASTLITGSTGVPVMTLVGGVLASNIYWVVGSSATINSGVGFAGTFEGNVIAQASIAVTDGGTINGSLVALVGAVTLAALTIINAEPFVPAEPLPVVGDVYMPFITFFGYRVRIDDAQNLLSMVTG